MKFDLSDLNPGVWFQFKDDDAAVCLKALSISDSQKMREQCTKIRYEYKDGQRIAIEDVDEKLRFELIADICIVDWKNIIDAADKLIPCTPKFKTLLMNNSIKFANFVTESLKTLNELKDEQSEIERKNS